MVRFHTGLGDNELTLTLANPACLQGFIRAYPDIPIVLLHASYPFTREAGYLAAVYANVYLDIGEVFPMISRKGQESVIQQALELTPSSKLCWSTDGHYFQETYSLAVRQVREALKVVLLEMVEKDDVTYGEAAQMVKDILFETSNILYGLDLSFGLSSLECSTVTRLAETNSPLVTFEAFLSLHPTIKFVRVSWIDYATTVRTRMVRVSHVLSQLREPGNNGSMGIGILAMFGLYVLANDGTALPDYSTIELDFCPDFENIYVHPRKNAQGLPMYGNVMAKFVERDGSQHAFCPRTVMLNALAKAEDIGIKDFKMGFEIEFCLFQSEALRNNRIESISDVHAWTSGIALQAGDGKALQILEDIMTALEESGINTYQFHSEAAKGQC